ncbi:MAG: phosphate regulon sensor histidine kinase PhoR [Luminiphilus sp.]|nr:phosphate regulon sensor histidine kinase PhoR [Luminiphilus sp.]
MTGLGFFRLEARRLLLSIIAGSISGLITADILIGVAAASSILLISWGWQLSRMYRWFANPDELPPIGNAGVRGVLRDVYVLRSRSLQGSQSASRAQPYAKESLASMREAALIVNVRLELVWCNDAAEYLLGIQFSEEEGRLLSEVIPGKSLKKYMRQANFQKPLRIKPGPDPEFCLQFEFSRFGVHDSLVFVKDVTAQDKLERMRSDFVGNVSHELRTPLTVIKGYIETLQSVVSEKEMTLQASLASMDTQAARMENLIADLLWLSRIESVEGERKEDLINISELLSTLVAELSLAWPERKLELKLDSPQSVLGDEAELLSAFSNLIVNALKYSDKHSITIKWIDTAVGPALLVEDKGLGIDAKHIPRLTERFYRVDKSRSQERSGTGLGLAIVKHVAVSHDAKLFVDSQLGKGSCFRLVFPASRTELAPESPGGIDDYG